MIHGTWPNGLSKTYPKKPRPRYVKTSVSGFNAFLTTCGGDATVLTEKCTSIAHHATNKHSWGGCKKFKKCAHHKLTKREMKSVPWIKPGSPSHKALQEVVFKKRFLNDLTKLTEFHHTGQLEVFDSLMLKYLPKRQHFPYQ